MNEVARPRKSFDLGQQRPASLAARMVHPLTDGGVETRAPYVATTFSVPEISGEETLRITALGLYRCFINGRRVGDDLLTPGWTSYDKRLAFQTYWVSDLLVPGENRIEIWLADGWYRSQLLWGRNAIYDTWGTELGALAELRESAEAGAPLLVATDGTWRSGLLPILKSGIYFGEVYDAREEDLNDADGVTVLDFDMQRLVPQETLPVRELAPLGVRKSWQDDQGRALFDFGQNCGGYVHLRVRGERGARVVVEHAEILDGDGHFENTNYRTAAARIEYVLKGTDEEDYRPHFTFQGFRYARVSIEGEADLLEISLVPVSSAQVQTGRLTTGNPLVNRLVENTLWSQRSNFIDVPTDCPQRDERLGWTGDAQVFANTSCYLFETQSFWRKWLRDLMADQREHGEIPHFSPDPTRLNPSTFPNAFGSTGWGDAICVVPMVLYEHYGDTDVLEETLPAMARWVDFVWSISDGPIVSPRGWGQAGFSFGDWLQPKGTSVKPFPTIGDDAAATIYLYIASVLTQKAAAIVGDHAVEQRMRERAAAVKTAFQTEFVTASGRVGYNDQTSYALAILYDLVPPDLLGKAVRHFKRAIATCSGRIGTGFIGTPALLPALTKVGEYELAQKVFLQEDAPGWLYQVKNGATTIWERWDAIQPDGTVFDPGMNSFNHYAYGAVGAWLFESVAGIRPDPEKPAFEHVIFEPVVLPELSPVKATIDTEKGPVEMNWAVEDDLVTCTVNLPEGASGTLVLNERYEHPEIDGKPAGWPVEDGKARGLLAPGTHSVTFRLRRKADDSEKIANGPPEPSFVEAPAT